MLCSVQHQRFLLFQRNPRFLFPPLNSISPRALHSSQSQTLAPQQEQQQSPKPQISQILSIRHSLLSRELSAVEIAESHLTRIRDTEPRVRSFLHLAEEESVIRQAQELDAKIGRNEDVGPLAGVLVGVKDNICTVDMPSTGGSRVLEGYRPPFDATAVKRVNDWGGIVVGKTNLDEFGMGSSTEGSAFQTRLQTQAAGAPYCHPLGNVISRMTFLGPTMMFADLRCSPSCARAGIQGTVSICPPDCFQYKGTFDTLYKIARQEGLLRLWRGTNAGLALAVPMVGIYLPCYDIFRDQMGTFVDANAPGLKPFVPLIAGSLARSLACSVCYPIDLAKTRMQAFKETGKKPPGVWRTLLGIISNVESTSSFQNRLQSYRVLWPGLGAQLARDVPFSAICWTTMEPIRRQLSASVGDEKTWALCFVLIFLPHFSLEALLLEQPVH